MKKRVILLSSLLVSLMLTGCSDDDVAKVKDAVGGFFNDVVHDIENSDQEDINLPGGFEWDFSGGIKNSGSIGFEGNESSGSIEDLGSINEVYLGNEEGYEYSDEYHYACELYGISWYSGDAYTYVNDNVPFFSGQYTLESFEDYSDLDELGRCGVAFASLSYDTMPTEERGDINKIKPSGWQSVKYDIVSGKYLYNRCHLIGFQLAGENDNPLNLITGTRYLNIDGMLGLENEVTDYIEDTGNHVLYRVTPIYTGNNLIADGVLMEAYSLEDNGMGIQACIFAYNVQPGIVIDYETGNSKLDE